MVQTRTTKFGERLLSPDELMDELENLRSEFEAAHSRGRRRGGSGDGMSDPGPGKRRPGVEPAQVLAEIAAQKRAGGRGGDGNHRFEGERYINTTNKDVRRFQLRKLVDEGGQTSVGGKVPSHPTLSKWNSEAFGLTPEEMYNKEKEDATPAAVASNGWYYWMHRTEPWPVLLGSALVGEGAKRLPAVRDQMIKALDETREFYEWLGIKDIEKAMLNQIEHSPIGADQDHVVFGENVTREHVNTPELQERLAKVFVLRLHRQGD
jgi:pyrroloquinoline quinone (PQQ) biosynthesis protein C